MPTLFCYKSYSTFKFSSLESRILTCAMPIYIQLLSNSFAQNRGRGLLVLLLRVLDCLLLHLLDAFILVAAVCCNLFQFISIRSILALRLQQRREPRNLQLPHCYSPTPASSDPFLASACPIDLAYASHFPPPCLGCLSLISSNPNPWSHTLKLG